MRELDQEIVDLFRSGEYKIVYNDKSLIYLILLIDEECYEISKVAFDMIHKEDEKKNIKDIVLFDEPLYTLDYLKDYKIEKYEGNKGIFEYVNIVNSNEIPIGCNTNVYYELDVNDFPKDLDLEKFFDRIMKEYESDKTLDANYYDLIYIATKK